MIRKKTILRLFLTSILAVTFGCDNKNGVKDYKYQNPESGKEVPLRAASNPKPLVQRSQSETQKQSVELEDATIQLDRTNKTVTCRITRNLYDDKGTLRSTERVELAGKFTNEGPARLRDVDAAKLGGPRLLGFAECVPDRFGQQCATLFVNVIYDSENHYKQFHAVFPSPSQPVDLRRPVPAPTGSGNPQGAPGNATGAQKPPKANSASATTPGAGPLSPDVVVTTGVQTTRDPVLSVDDDIYDPVEVVKIEEGSERDASPDQMELPEGDSHDQDGGSGSFVSNFPTNWEDVKKILPNPWAKPTPKPAPPKGTPPNGRPNTPSTTPATPGQTVPGTPPGSRPGQPATPPTGKSSPGAAAGNGQPQTSTGIPLKLTGGGTSINTHETGRIDQKGTLFPISTMGATRASSEDVAYGSGFAIDFMTQSSRVFAMANPQCGNITYNQISKPNGGPILRAGSGCARNRRVYANGRSYCQVHGTHFNGLDFDISYFGTPWTDYVYSERQTQRGRNSGKTRVVVVEKMYNNRRFNYDCFLKYTKFMYDQKFANVDSENDGVELVDLIWVNKAIQDGICQYVKQNNLKNEYQDALSLIYPEDGHDSHFHVRMRCSPKHNTCFTRDFDRELPFRKRGCRNL